MGQDRAHLGRRHRSQLAVLSGHSDSVSTATFSPDGQLVLTASFDKTVRIWNSFTGQGSQDAQWPHRRGDLRGFARDGQRIVTSSNDKTARVWDTASGRQLLVLLHPAKVNTAAFSPDGIHVVTSSFDNTARIWDVRTAPIEVQVRWVAASQFDALPVRSDSSWGCRCPTTCVSGRSDRSKCDEAAAAPYDPDRQAPGALLDQIVGDVAEQACGTEGDGEARALYQLGRALMANGKLPAARQALDRALAMGYRSAAVDLATLLSQEPGSPRDVSVGRLALRKRIPQRRCDCGISPGSPLRTRGERYRAAAMSTGWHRTGACLGLVPEGGGPRGTQCIGALRRVGG